MKHITFCLSAILLSIAFLSCEKDNNPVNNTTNNAGDGSVIAGNEVATELVLRTIPVEYINKARNLLHISYTHTSHGTHVSYGMFGLQDFKAGDDVLFGITNHSRTENKLDFHDNTGADLSIDETAFIGTTRNFLDDHANDSINIIMWSWCDISGHNVTENYLPGMQALINEYGTGGSKIGPGDGQRPKPVTFIFMTGHANANNNLEEKQPKQQADTIINYCKAKGYFCLDYYSIDTHDMNGNYWNDAGDDGNSEAYGGNFYQEWQDSHILGTHYFENKDAPLGDVTYGAHNSQHITANRKAYAMWYILARIAGWDGK